MSRDEAFLQRWSRRKRAKPKDRERDEAAARPAAPPAEADRKTRPPAPEVEDGDPKVISELPPMESLGKDSDYSAFMKKGVPEALRQQALRRLWASDPVLAQPDPLDLHNLDYTFLARGGEVVKTTYQVGKGFVDAVEESADEKPASPDKAEAAKKDEAADEGAEDRKSSVKDPAPPDKTGA